MACGLDATAAALHSNVVGRNALHWAGYSRGKTDQDTIAVAVIFRRGEFQVGRKAMSQAASVFDRDYV